MRERQSSIRDLLVRTADKMPPEKYGYRLEPTVMSFGDLIVHIASVQIGDCAQALEDRSVAAIDLSQTDKATAAKLLEASFDYCERAFTALTDDNASEPRGLAADKQRPRIEFLLAALNHNNLEYGKLTAYLRLNGIVPPSSDRTSPPAAAPTADPR